MNRYLERKKEYLKALNKLEEGLNQKENELVIDGILHRFEFTFELAWKVMKDYLEYQGVIGISGSPREIIKLAFKQEIISDGEGWIEMMLARNNLSHIYSEETSRNIYNDIKNKYKKLLKEFAIKAENI